MREARCGLAAALIAAGSAATPARAEIFFSDTYLSYRHLFQDKQPGYAGNVQEDALNISYANGWTYGSNFASLDLENFSDQDPANSVTGHGVSDSFEFYGLVRSTVSGNKVTGSKTFSFGPIADIGLEFGADVDTQDDQFASYKRLVVFGPQFAINLPKGFWTISTVLSKEWNTNAYLPNTNATNFNPTGEIETAWLYPINVGGLPVAFTGFANFIGPKGSGGTGDLYHHTEILVHPKLMVDMGALLGFAPHQIEAGVGYEYWHNKFGNTKPPLTGTEQNSVFLEIGYHF
jgi:nucleoside-specific outer membrane channel protein Tsx